MLNNNSKPRPVISSGAAKNHLAMAKVAMDETLNGIIQQRQMLDQEQMMKVQSLQEQQKTTDANAFAQRQLETKNAFELERTQMANAHDMEMQKQKLDSVKTLI